MGCNHQKNPHSENGQIPMFEATAPKVEMISMRPEQPITFDTCHEENEDLTVFDDQK